MSIDPLNWPIEVRARTGSDQLRGLSFVLSLVKILRTHRISALVLYSMLCVSPADLLVHSGISFSLSGRARRPGRACATART